MVVSRSLAHDSGLSVGSVVEMTLLTGGGQLTVTVAGLSPVVPGIPSGYGVMADLATVQDAAIRQDLRPISATEWWVSTTRPEAAAAQIVKRGPLGTTTMTQATPPADQVLESARTAIWIAGAATALLAMLAITAGLLAELRTRREEVDILRALGVPPEEQARQRATEWGALLVLGVVVGLLDGFLVCGILVPGLARMAVPNAIDALRTSFGLDPIGALLSFVLLAIALAGLRRRGSGHGAQAGSCRGGLRRDGVPMTARWTARRLLARRFLMRPTASILVAVLAVLTVGIAAVVPRLVAQQATAELAFQLNDIGPTQRSLQGSSSFPENWPADPPPQLSQIYDSLQSSFDDARAQFPRLLRGQVGRAPVDRAGPGDPGNPGQRCAETSRAPPHRRSDVPVAHPNRAGHSTDDLDPYRPGAGRGHGGDAGRCGAVGAGGAAAQAGSRRPGRRGRSRMGFPSVSTG